MTIRNNTAEGQSSGTALTTANSGGGSGDAYDSVSKGVAGAAAFDNAQFMHTAQSYHVTGGATDTAILIYSGANDTSAAIRCYIRINTLPSNAQDLMVIRDSAGNAAKFGISATNKFTISDSIAVLSTFASTVSTGTWYRLELECIPGTASTGVVNGRYFLGDSTTAQDTPFTTSTANAGITNLTNGRYGKITAAGTGFDMWYDDTAWNNGSSTPLGPSAVSTGAAVAEADTITAAGAVGVVASAAVAPNDAITTAGLIGAVGIAAINDADTITTAGVVGASTSAAIAPNDAITAASAVGVSTAAAVNPVDTVIATAQVGARTSTALTETDTITATGAVTSVITAAPIWTLTTTAAGVVTVIPVPGLAGNLGYIGEGPTRGAVAYDVPRSMIGGIDN